MNLKYSFNLNKSIKKRFLLKKYYHENICNMK